MPFQRTRLHGSIVCQIKKRQAYTTWQSNTTELYNLTPMLVLSSSCVFFMSCDIHSHNAAAADILVVANDIMEQWKFI